MQYVSGVDAPAGSLETNLQTKGGEDRMIAWRNALVRDDAGQVIGVLRSGGIMVVAGIHSGPLSLDLTAPRTLEE